MNYTNFTDEELIKHISSTESSSPVEQELIKRLKEKEFLCQKINKIEVEIEYIVSTLQSIERVIDE